MQDTQIAHPELLSEIQDFLAARNMPKTTFGWEAVRDKSLITQIENGRELRRRTLNRVRNFMAEAGSAEASQ